MYEDDYLAETVYDLIQQPVQKQAKQKRYRSKHSGVKPPSFSTLCLKGSSKPNVCNLDGTLNHLDDIGSKHNVSKGKGTLGKDVKNLHTTQNYLRKNDGIEKSFSATSTKATNVEGFKRNSTFKKPAVPKRHEKPIMGLVTKKNFIEANAIDNILAEPKRKMNTRVNYLHKKDFGKTPKYLQQRKKELAEQYSRDQEMYTMQMENAQDKVRSLTYQERKQLLNGLEANLADAHKRFQSLPFIMDTQAKVKRKEAIEQEIDRIERDIQTLSKKNILIYDDEY